MIALDTNVLVRFLVADDQHQAEAARRLLKGLSNDRPGYICREVAVELGWVLERSYGFDRIRIAEAFTALAETAGIRLEEREDVVAAAAASEGGPGMPDRLTVSASRRAGASALYTFDRQVAALEGAALVHETAWRELDVEE